MLNKLFVPGMHVTGVIRFASTGEGEDFRQIDDFEVLGRSHDEPGDEHHWPKLKPHPVQAAVRKGVDKLQRIPVKVVFNEAKHGLSARYEAFDTALNRRVCVGDGERCTRIEAGQSAVKQETCLGPQACAFANSETRRCDLQVRLSVQLPDQEDKLSVFEFQSSGIHTYRTLSAKLMTLAALFKDKLRHAPLELCMYEKSSPAYDFKPFYVADLQLRSGVTMADALKQAGDDAAAEAAAGIDFQAVEKMMEDIQADHPLAFDDPDHGIVVFNPAPPATRAKSGANAFTPTSLATVVRSAKELAASDKSGEAPAETPSALPVLNPSGRTELPAISL